MLASPLSGPASSPPSPHLSVESSAGAASVQSAPPAESETPRTPRSSPGGASEAEPLSGRFPCSPAPASEASSGDASEAEAPADVASESAASTGEERESAASAGEEKESVASAGEERESAASAGSAEEAEAAASGSEAPEAATATETSGSSSESSDSSESSKSQGKQVAAQTFQADFRGLEAHVKEHSFPAHLRTCGLCLFWKNRCAWSARASFQEEGTGKEVTWLACSSTGKAQ